MSERPEILKQSFSEVCYAFDATQLEFTDKLEEVGKLDFDGIGWDAYDNSLEILMVKPLAELTEEAQKLIYDAGFSKVYLNHTDGSETHYNWHGTEGFSKHPGWRKPNKQSNGVYLAEPKP